MQKSHDALAQSNAFTIHPPPPPPPTPTPTPTQSGGFFLHIFFKKLLQYPTPTRLSHVHKARWLPPIRLQLLQYPPPCPHMQTEPGGFHHLIYSSCKTPQPFIHRHSPTTSTTTFTTLTISVFLFILDACWLPPSSSFFVSRIFFTKPPTAGKTNWISLKFVSNDSKPALIQIMAWQWTGAKPLSEPMMVYLLTHKGNNHVIKKFNCIRQEWSLTLAQFICILTVISIFIISHMVANWFVINQRWGFFFLRDESLVIGIIISLVYDHIWGGTLATEKSNKKMININTLRPQENSRQFATTISNSFSWRKKFIFWFKLHLCLFLRVQLAINQDWFR